MRRFIVISSLAVVIATTAQIPAPAAAATAPVFIVDGHGWGHGHGMGQYGARAQAIAGAPWNQILTSYYTGIRLERPSTSQRIRVLLNHSRNLIVKPGGHLSITWDSGKLAVSTHRVSMYFWIGRAGAASVVMAARSPSGPFRRVASAISKVVRISGTTPVAIVGASSTRWYRGTIDLVPSGRGFDVIDNLPLEQYVSEVVPREMPASWPIEALKAQAVAARTYVLRIAQAARSQQKNHDICSSTACQVFGGYARTVNGAIELLENRRTNAATASTAGWIMTWQGKPILAEYSSSTGGYTTSGGFPYLAPRPDPWDISSPLHSWSETVDAGQIQASWPSVGSVRTVTVTARDGHGDFGGRALSLLISGSRGSLRVSGTAFQYAFALPSDLFRLRSNPSQYRFTFNVGYGMHNAAVRFLQERLRSAGVYPKGAPFSNYFGPITRAALEGYQRAQHIAPSGFLGPVTRARLNATAS